MRERRVGQNLLSGEREDFGVNRIVNCELHKECQDIVDQSNVRNIKPIKSTKPSQVKHQNISSSLTSTSILHSIAATTSIVESFPLY